MKSKSEEFRKLEADELGEKLTQAEKSLQEMRFKSVHKELKNTSEIRSTRRDIARLKHAMHEKKIEAAASGQGK